MKLGAMIGNVALCRAMGLLWLATAVCLAFAGSPLVHGDDFHGAIVCLFASWTGVMTASEKISQESSDENAEES